MTEGVARVQPDSVVPSKSPFTGMVPTRRASNRVSEAGTPLLVHRDTGRVSQGFTRGLAATMPLVLASSMAITTIGLEPHPLVNGVKADSVHPDRAHTPVPLSGGMTKTYSVSEDNGSAPTSGATRIVPSTYTVEGGDSLSDIAERYGLPLASVLALNGLSWKSLLFPGQVLRLTSTDSPAATPAPLTTPAAPTAVVAATTYTIASGDTITSIARHFGVSIQSILAANHLTASSIIYPGRTLVIGGSAAPAVAPVASAPPSVVEPAQVGGTVVPLSPSMAENAGIIISVGKSLGVPAYGIVIALATAAQESHLENLGYGDRDSVGLFQQRPSSGWGTVAQLENPTYAAELFYGGPSNPNRGRTRGLLDVAGWQQMTVTQAAQAVQISGAPNAYAKWEASARAWFAQLG